MRYEKSTDEYDRGIEAPPAPGEVYETEVDEPTLREVLEPLGKGPRRKSEFSTTSRDGTPAHHNDTFDLI